MLDHFLSVRPTLPFAVAVLTNWPIIGPVQAASSIKPSASHEQPMPEAIRDTINILLRQSYSGCWSYSPAALAAYRPIFKVTYGVDGSLLGEPKLLDPPSTPEEQHQAESALKAIKRCDSLQLSNVYARYYNQWRDRVLYFGEIGTGVPSRDPLALVIDSVYKLEDTPSMPANVVDDFLRYHLTRCWAYTGPGVGDYVPEVKVVFAEDGSLAGPPTLLNPATEPKARRLGADALKAIASCAPVPPPIDFRRLPVRWRDRILRLDPRPPAP